MHFWSLGFTVDVEFSLDVTLAKKKFTHVGSIAKKSLENK